MMNERGVGDKEMTRWRGGGGLQLAGQRRRGKEGGRRHAHPAYPVYTSLLGLEYCKMEKFFRE